MSTKFKYIYLWTHVDLYGPRPDRWG